MPAGPPATQEAGERAWERSDPARRRLRPAEGALIASLGGLLLWIGIEARRAGPGVGLAEHLPYWSVPLVLGVGVLIGRHCMRWGIDRLLTAVAAALVVATAVVDPFYSNAEAAAGVQLVALADLLMRRPSQRPTGRRAERWTVALAAVVATTGVLLAAASQATSVLVILVAGILAVAVHSDAMPSRLAVRAVGMTGIAAAVSAVGLLGFLPRWPPWLSSGESLSGARHRLWGDALALWQEHPVLGGGLGSFYEHSETARSDDLLYAVHSSILQVGAELGAIGALLFLAVLVSGTLVASQGDPARGLIGVTAWSALAIHSMIDHLFEFTLVCLVAGLVIGSSGSGAGAGADAGVGVGGRATGPRAPGRSRPPEPDAR